VNARLRRFLVRASLDLPGNQTYNDRVIQTVIRAGGRGERLRWISVGRVVSLEQECSPQLIAEHQFAVFATKWRFYNIGMPSRLKEIEAVL